MYKECIFIIIPFSLSYIMLGRLVGLQCRGNCSRVRILRYEPERMKRNILYIPNEMHFVCLFGVSGTLGGLCWVVHQLFVCLFIVVAAAVINIKNKKH